MKHIYRKKNLLTAGLLVCALLLSGCNSAALDSTEEELTPVMTIDGFEVPYELYRYVILNHKNDYESGLSEAEAANLWTGTEGEALLTELEDDTAETLLGLYATVSLAARYNLTTDNPLISESVDVLMDEVYEGFEEDWDLYKSEMAAYYMNDSVYRFLMQNDVLTEELFYAMINAGDILSDEQTLRDMVESDDFIRVKQILIASDNGKTEEENRAQAEKVHALLQDGADFEDLLDKYGGDLFMFNNDDGYYITRGIRHEAFEEAAFSLEIGEYSDVVETSAGFSILMRYEKEPEYLEAHFEELCQEYWDSAYNALVQAHLETLTIEELPVLEKYSIFTME